jgi:hypothetical protein
MMNDEGSFYGLFSKRSPYSPIHLNPTGIIFAILPIFLSKLYPFTPLPLYLSTPLPLDSFEWKLPGLNDLYYLFF